MVASGAVASRADAKVGMLGAMYGATRGESGRLMPGLTRRYPRAIGLVEAAARAGERGEVVHTLLGRGSPVPDGAWAGRPVEPGGPDEVGESSAEDRDRARRSWGRFTRNFVVQGTGAEWALCWLADLRNRLWRLGGPGTASRRPHLVFFLHDEVVVHTPEELAGAVVEEVRRAATAAGRLLFGAFPIDFPLDVAVVRSWADAD
jgi:DNA polymerase-1